jgi:hypothetical protein
MTAPTVWWENDVRVLCFEPIPCRHCNGTGFASLDDPDDFCPLCGEFGDERWLAIQLAVQRTGHGDATLTVEWRGVLVNPYTGATFDLRDGVAVGCTTDDALLRTLAYGRITLVGSRP